MDYMAELTNHNMRLFKRYSLQCPDEAQGYHSLNVVKPLGNMSYKTLGQSQLVSYVTVEVKTVRDKGEVLKMTAFQASTQQEKNIFQRAGHLPAYFLPWDKSGGIVEMTIPELSPALPKTDYPDLFFTAALSGCSVFVKGTPREPTVQHCGIETANSDTFSGMNAEAYWRFLSEYIEMSAPVRGYRDISGEANKKDYVSGYTDPSAVASAGPAGWKPSAETTKNAVKFEKKLKTHYASHPTKPVDIQLVLPWGCVFGLRNGAGNWTFYLQENAIVSYFRKDALGATVGPLIQASRPMVVREIFPTAAPAARLKSTFRTLVP